MRNRAAQVRHRGFTFVELVIGMVVTTIVLCALGMFTFGVGENWTQSDSAQSAFLQETMAVERLSHMIREAQLAETNPTIGSMDNSAPPATCMIWTDSNLDGHIQYCELAVLQYIPATQKVVEWAIPATASNALSTTTSFMSDATFLALPNVASTTIADNVLACRFFSIPGVNPTQLPSLEVVLKIQSNNPAVASQVVYTTVALRAPNLSPN